MMGPVGKCLETALDELLAEDDNNSSIRSCSNNNNDDDDEDESSSSSNDNTNNSIKLDKSISRSILESYRKAVVETKFDHHERQLNNTISSTTSSHNVNNNSTMASVNVVAPAAMIKGEIDHYNRIGGQWRIVVKNAVLKRRSLTTLDNGMIGRSRRRRTVLDWEDDDNDNDNDDDDDNGSSAKVADDQKQSASVTESNTKRNDDKSDVSLGTIQILAYDDDT